jgi:hypothetical protein
LGGKEYKIAKEQFIGVEFFPSGNKDVAEV